MTEQPVGTCCLVLHSHLPWLAHHGVWPVGEEWLHQAWSATYLPLAELLGRPAGEGRQGLLTLGVTPVLAAQLDDVFLLRQFHTWLADWQLRAEGLVGQSTGLLREAASREFVAAARATDQFERTWRQGGSVPLRRLADDGVIELLGGPATHPILPGLSEPWRRFAIDVGLDDAALRFGARPQGIWLPECAYRPGLEAALADTGVRHVVVDEMSLPAVVEALDGGRPLWGTDVIGFGNDWPLVQLVWGAPDGYPAGPWYRDFHAFEPTTGLQTSRITGPGVAHADKAPYEPEAAARAAAADAVTFAHAVRSRLLEHRERTGRPGLAVVAIDTELFGHWWHEGPQFLEHLLRALPEAGVTPSTLTGAVADGLVAEPMDAGPATWGVDKDFGVWEGPAVADLATEQRRVQAQVADVVAARLHGDDARRPELDQLVRQTLLLLASDWPFLVSHDQGAEYAKGRFAGHRQAVVELLEVLARDDGTAAAVAARQRDADYLFGHLDARLLAAAVAAHPG